jgi:hypothetical protein
MPITRTVSGLKYERPLDSLDEGDHWDNVGNFAWSIDTDNKEEGSGSLKLHGYCTSPSYPGGGYFYAIPGAASAVGDRVHIWHKAADSKHNWSLRVSCYLKTPCTEGSVPYPSYTTDVITRSTSEGWTLKKANLPSNLSDYNKTIYPQMIRCSGAYQDEITDWVDHLVISSTYYLTVTGLSPGQKVEVYRASDDVKIVEATCAGGQTQIVVDIDAEDYPEYMYLKVYATDGVTLVEKTANQRICGGDTWAWTAPLGTLDIKSDVYTLYRTGSSGTATSAAVTATLRTPAGAPYPGATVQFLASKGSLSASSDVTDSNGEAHTSISSTEHGIAVVRAYWPGDASVPAAVAYATHHVLYDLEVGDSNKKFQLFIEGIEYPYSNGRYVLSDENTPQEWSVEIPEWSSTITRRGLVSIYRKGVKEQFSGVLTLIERTLSDPSRIVLSGADTKSLLDTRVVTIKDYSSKTVLYMLTDLLTNFWCGVSLGVVSDYPGTLTQTFADETVGSSIARLCDYIGWQYRVTAAIKLDVKPTFGSILSDVTFTQGVNLFLNSYRLDDRQICNSIRMRGAEDLVSTVFDGTSIMDDDLGLLEEVAFQKSIGVQDTLDIAANAELARRSGKNEAIQAEVLDNYDPGTWGLDDSVTLTVPEHDLSDVYKIVRIERDMTDPGWARVDFVNKLSLEWTDLYQALRRELKDLGAKTAI